MPQDAEPVRLCFENNGSDVNYWLDNIVFYEGRHVPSDKGNIFT
jgi:hypothetical protein